MITDYIGRVGLNRLPNKKVVLLSSLEIPGITDRPQTMLFDWEDFEIAGSIEKLAETIKTRQQYEKTMQILQRKPAEKRSNALRDAHREQLTVYCRNYVVRKFRE